MNVIVPNPEFFPFMFVGWDTKTDTWIITERLRPLLTNVEYQRGGKTVAKVVHFAGYAGLVTGIKPVIIIIMTLMMTDDDDEEEDDSGDD